MPLDDPDFVQLEWRLLQGTSKLENAERPVSRSDNFTRAFALAGGASKTLDKALKAKDFSFLTLVRSGCGRPARLLNAHLLVIGKGWVVAAALAIDLAALAAGIALLPAGVGAALIATAVLSFAAVAVLIGLGC